MGPGGGPADEGRGVLQSRVAAHARADEELADLAPEPRRVGDDGAEIDVVGEAIERTAESYQRARVVGNGGVLGIVDDRPGMGKLAPDLEEGGKLDRRRLADGAMEQRALGGRIEAIAVLQDVGNEAPGAGAGKGSLPRLGVADDRDMLNTIMRQMRQRKQKEGQNED